MGAGARPQRAGQRQRREELVEIGGDKPYLTPPVARLRPVAMGAFVVTGSFYARRGDWQPFRKQHEAESPEQAREWALSEIGGCHHLKRHLIRIESVTPAETAQ